MTRLYEENQLFVYEDENTGIKYLFDGKKLVEMPDNNSGDSDKPYHVEYDDDEKNDSDSSGSGSENSDPNGGSDDDSPNDNQDENQDPTSGEGNSDSQGPEEDSSDGSEGSSDSGEQEQSNDKSSGKSGGKSSSENKGLFDDSNDSSEDSEDASLDDVDFDDWDDLKNKVSDVLNNIDDLTDEEKEDFYKELSKHTDEVDKDTLEKEAEERREQIEKEAGEYNPNSEDAGPRLKEIADAIADEATYNAIMDETDTHVYQDRAKRNKEKKKAEAEAKKYSANRGIKDFVLDLNRLIKSEVRAITTTSWGRINKKTEGTGLIRPGKIKKKNPNIPRLFVYFDVSSSWSSQDHQIGIQAVETLNTYVKKKQLVVELYYFADRVSSDPNDCGTGTAAGAKLIEHIKINKPNNVCVMTDSDFDSWGEIFKAPRIAVPGGVFLLFRNGDISKGLIDRLRGKRMSKSYSF